MALRPRRRRVFRISHDTTPLRETERLYPMDIHNSVCWNDRADDLAFDSLIRRHFLRSL